MNHWCMMLQCLEIVYLSSQINQVPMTNIINLFMKQLAPFSQITLIINWTLKQINPYVRNHHHKSGKFSQWFWPCLFHLGSVHIWRQQDFANVTPPPSCQHWATALMTSAFARPHPPPFQSDIRFSKNPLALYSTLTETINVYFIELKTERCQVNFMCNYNHLIKNILEIGPLADVSKAETPSPLSATVSILKHIPPSAADVICERSLIRVYICDPFRETNPPLVCILYWLNPHHLNLPGAWKPKKTVFCLLLKIVFIDTSFYR